MNTAAPVAPSASRRPAGRARLLLVFALAAFAPIGAEYLSGYDDTTGDPAELLAGLILLGGLYGGPAILIREIARRFALGWRGMFALAGAFAVLQAGAIDQSIFSSSYRGIDYWSAMVGPTWIEPLGMGAFPTMLFLVGHVAGSFAAPIALAESIRPDLARRPWLRLPGLIVTVVVYLLAAAAILGYHLSGESDHASLAQLVGAGLAVVGLAVLAFGWGRKDISTASGRVPPLWIIGLAALVVSGLYAWSFSWFGFASGAAALTGLAVGIANFSRSTAWGQRQVIALATGFLLAIALHGFLITPLGAVDAVAKYAHNTVATIGVLAFGWWLLRRNREFSLRQQP